MTTAYDFSATDDRRHRASSSPTTAARSSLVVNTATQCGFTPQYGALEELYEKYADRGSRRAGLPVRPVRRPGAGRRGRDRDVLRVARSACTFPMFSKVEVNGADAHPLYQWLQDREEGRARRPRSSGTSPSSWSTPTGHVVKRYGSTTKPEDIADDIEKLLPAEPGAARSAASACCVNGRSCARGRLGAVRPLDRGRAGAVDDLARSRSSLTAAVAMMAWLGRSVAMCDRLHDHGVTPR